jgi:uroporphyrinogen-III synthase
VHRRGYNKSVPKPKELEARLERTEQQLRLFQKISRFMVRDLSLQDVLKGVVDLVVEFTQCDSCLLYLLDGEELVLCASNTPHPSTIGKVKLRLNEGLTGWVARERRLVAISREAYKDARFKNFGELPEDSFEAFLSSPLIARNRVIGVINVQHRLPHQHTGSEMEVITTVGEQIGCVLVLARMTAAAMESANHVELVLSSGPVPMKQ